MMCRLALILAFSNLNSSILAADCLHWRTDEIPGRTGHGFVYDTLRDVYVVFGGTRSGLAINAEHPGLGDTWELTAGGEWKLRANSGPSPRHSFGMAYDAARGVTVVFGGAANDNLNNETWEWDGATWTLTATTGPSPRYAHAMTFDALRGEIVLFGGNDGTADLGDTWTWDGVEWTEVITSGPTPRRNHAMCYDSDNDVVALNGGSAGSLETWAWDGASWALIASDRGYWSSHQLVYDGARQQLMLLNPITSAGQLGRLLQWEFDGVSWSLTTIHDDLFATGCKAVLNELNGKPAIFGGYYRAPLNEIYEYDSVRWNRTSVSDNVPPELVEHRLAYDSTRDRIVLFGGLTRRPPYEDFHSATGETWEWNGHDWEFKASTGPGGLIGHAMAFDAVHNQTVLFGGSEYPSNTLLGDTWTWDGDEWQLVSTSGPSPRRYSAMAFDAIRQQVVLYGGGENDELSETWLWDGSSWTQALPKSNPGPRSAHAMTFDTVRGEILLWGGSNSDNSLWAWNGNDWQLRSTDGPPARTKSSFVHDPLTGHSYVLGGRLLDLSYSTTMSAWDGTSWLASESLPGDLAQFEAAFHTEANQLIAFGGVTDPNMSIRWVPIHRSTLRFDGETWNSIGASIPGPRSDAVMAYDPSRNTTVLYGGTLNFRIDDTWEFDGLNWRQVFVPGPGLDEYAVMTFDPSREKIVAFGSNPTQNREQTWTWDGSQWDLVTPEGPNRTPLAILFDPVREQLLLMLANGARHMIFDNKQWVDSLVSGTPNAHDHAGFVFDTSRSICIFDGGRNIQQTAEWDGSQWTHMSTPGRTAAKAGHWAYSPAWERTLAYGGFNSGSDETFSRVDSWDGTEWTLLSETGAGPRFRGASAYDTFREVWLIFGGIADADYNNQNALEDFWEWDADAGAPEIVRPIVAPVVQLGASGTIAAQMRNDKPEQYLWLKNDIALVDGNTPYGSTIAGATTATLQISNARYEDRGAYTLRVVNDCGMITSDAVSFAVRLTGDMNCDGAITVSDIGWFVQALTQPAQYAIEQPDCDLLHADTNADGAVTVSDIGDFIELLIGG